MIANMVPIGMDLWASRRSPDRFEPAIIPGRQQIGTHSVTLQNPLLYTDKYH